MATANCAQPTTLKTILPTLEGITQASFDNDGYRRVVNRHKLAFTTIQTTETDGQTYTGDGMSDDFTVVTRLMERMESGADGDVSAYEGVGDTGGMTEIEALTLRSSILASENMFCLPVHSTPPRL